VRAIVGEVNRFRPRTVWGYVDALYTIAQYARAMGLEIRHPPAAVLGGGGTMFPPMREAIAGRSGRRRSTSTARARWATWPASAP
jgi:hypothetical protein